MNLLVFVLKSFKGYFLSFEMSFGNIITGANNYLK
uniref:Uncharacterized protein n=1 Tax=Anguilla anguilla TaxID=7936 RepID=A0A0E9X9U9_ANGAN